MRIGTFRAGTTRKRRLSMLAAAIVATIAISGAVAAPAQADATSNKCGAAYVFIGLRGTGAPAGSTLGAGGRTWLSGGFGDQVAPLATKWRNTPGVPVYTESIAYTAGPVDNNYLSSVNDGTNKLLAELTSLLSCQIRPMVILAGHSQGAHAMLNAIASPNFTNEMKYMVKAVVSYGDPTFVSGRNYNSPNAAPSGAGQFPRPVASYSYLEAFQTYAWPPNDPSATGPRWMSKIRSYCFSGDWACQAAPYNAQSNALHNTYSALDNAAYTWSHDMTLIFD